MSSTTNLGLPFIEGSQAQKHITHNESLRILDAAIQIAVLDLTRTTPPSSPAEGQRHVVASGATGAWAGQARAIATWQDGAWAFLPPHTGWCIWSAADNVMFVFDGTAWRDLRDLPVTLDNAVRVGINTTASSPNLLSVKSNAVLLSAINVVDSGTGDARLQISKESAAKTASVFFSDAFSGRAEFGLVGSDAFKLKVSADGSVWTEAFNVDQSSGNIALPRGLLLSGVIAPPQITANQNNYNPTGITAASVMQLSSDAARSLSGLVGGVEGRIVSLINVGSQSITLLDESASSTAANRFTLGGDLSIPAKQAAMLRYDGTATRWQAIARPVVAGALLAASNLADLASASAARTNLGLGSIAVKALSDTFALTNTTEATGAGTTAAALFAGGIEVGKKLFVGGAASLSSSADATSSSNGGAFSVPNGGGAIAKQLMIGGKFSVITSAAGAIGPTIELSNSNGSLGDAAALNFVDAGLRGQLRFSIDRSPYGADMIYFGGASGTTEVFRARSDGAFAMAGDLSVHPSSSVTPVNNGDLVFQATSNTSLTFKYKGSDGTVRSGSIALS